MGKIVFHPAARRLADRTAPAGGWPAQRPSSVLLVALAACCLSFGTTFGVAEAFATSGVPAAAVASAPPSASA